MRKAALTLLLATLAAASRAETVTHIPSSEAAQTIGLDLLERASGELFVSRFSMQSDSTGRFTLGRFIRAAQRGVKVKLLLNGVTSNPPKEWVSYAISQGVEIREFNPFSLVGALQAVRNAWRARCHFWSHLCSELSGVNWSRWNIVNTQRHMHDKVSYFTVGERSYTLIGGRNITDEDYGDPQAKRAKIDSDVLLESETVNAQIREHFLHVFDSEASLPLKAVAIGAEQRQRIERELFYYDALVERRRAHQFLHRHLDHSFEIAADRIEFIHDRVGEKAAEGGSVGRLLVLLGKAQRSLLIETPYLLPDERVRSALQAAVKRGVKVKIVTNSRQSTDEALPQSVYEMEKERLLALGVELYEFRGPETLHGKRIVADERWSYVGSLNLNSRSLAWDLETGLIFDDSAFAQFLSQEIKRWILVRSRRLRRVELKGHCGDTLLGIVSRQVREHL